MKTIKVNKTASKGIVIGRAYLWKKADMTPANNRINENEKDKEIARFMLALQAVEGRIKLLADSSGIFAGHLLILRDPMLVGAVTEKIREQRNAEEALHETMKELTNIFDSMDDEYMKERAEDVRDVCFRIMACLKNVQEQALPELNEQVILVARELVPSEISAMDASSVLGIVTELGGATSHVSILAGQKGIPILTGVTDILKDVKEGEMLILDTTEGLLILSPDKETLKQYEQKRIDYLLSRNQMEEMSSLPAITRDGKRIRVCANVGSLKELKEALRRSVDGIGLFRSEFLYMEKDHFPKEEEQFQVYKQIAEQVEEEVIIRTLDIGGDKELPYYRIGDEDNPFLGWRGIRISLELTGIFKTQLRAILRAGHYGRLKIMFPMITSLEELYQGKKLVEQCKQELKEEGVLYREDIEVGIMIETPAAVLCIDNLARQADFFSIGTNDLTQYLLATDRNNPKTSSLYNHFHPAVLRSIKRVIDAGKTNHKRVAMCGEFAGNPEAVSLLLGMGLEEFSVSADLVAEIKSVIRATDYGEARQQAERVLQAATVKEIQELLRQ